MVEWSTAYLILRAFEDTLITGISHKIAEKLDPTIHTVLVFSWLYFFIIIIIITF